MSSSHKAQLSGFRPDKTRAASFSNGFKNIPGKACVKRVHNNGAFVNVGNKHTRKNIKHSILVRRRFSVGFKTTARDVLSTI